MMNKIAELVTILGGISAERREAEDKAKLLKAKEFGLKQTLLEELHAQDLLTAKTDKFTASIAKRKNIVITHEQSVINWLEETPNIETDQYIGLKKTEFRSLAIAMLKDTGEVIPGTDLEITESLSLRSNK